MAFTIVLRNLVFVIAPDLSQFTVYGRRLDGWLRSATTVAMLAGWFVATG